MADIPYYKNSPFLGHLTWLIGGDCITVHLPEMELTIETNKEPTKRTCRGSRQWIFHYGGDREHEPPSLAEELAIGS